MNVRHFFTILFAIVTVISLLNLTVTIVNKESKDSRRTVVFLLICAISMCLVQVFYMNAISKNVSMICLGMYSNLTYWTMYLSCIYIQKYANTFKESIKVRMFFLAFGIVDIFAMGINYFTEIAFSISPKMYHAEPVYAISHYGFYYYIHLAMAAFLALIVLIAITYRIFVSRDGFSRSKFISVFILGWAAFITRIVVLIKHLPFDHSLVFICLFINLTTYLMYGYVPKLLYARITKTLVNEMNECVVMFDPTGDKIIYSNDIAEKLINSQYFYKMTYEGLVHINSVNDETPFFYETSLRLDDSKKTYSVAARKVIEGVEEIGILFSFNDRTKELEDIERNYYNMTHDGLTGIYNFDYFCQKAYDTIQNNPDTNYYLVTNDIFEFKLFNDLFGSEKGDEVLITSAKLLTKYCSENSVYGRIKDDEFAVLVREEDYSDELFVGHISRIREMFSRGSYKIYMNAGVYKITDRQEPIFSMCDKTKLAINSIKDDYSVLIKHFSEDLLLEAKNRRWILDELDNALESGQFKMFLQPQVDSKTGEWIGGEALIRWIHPERAMISPGEFIPVIENAGVISKVDLYIWNQAAMKLAEWKIEGKDELYISVNVSGKDFKFLDVFEVFKNLVRTYNIAPSRLRIEITESALADNVELMKDVISRLRTNGFIVEIDDFGSGYSSLNSLKDFEVDVIKMDMGFLSRSSDEEKSRMIFTDVVEMIHHLDMDIVVEGVEEEDQLRFVSNLGCNTIQGYYYSKPLPESTFDNHFGL